MARDDDYGAAQPIVDVGRKVYDAVTNFGKRMPPKEKQKKYEADPGMVKEANDSFRVSNSHKPATRNKPAPKTKRRGKTATKR